MVGGQVEDLREMIVRLEQQELDCQTGSGSVPTSVYTELLAAYLAQGELCLAKFLWKRIPENIKQTEGEEVSELTKVWNVGKGMWARDYPAVYSALKTEWSPQVSPIMTRLESSQRESALSLVCLAYSSISLALLAEFLGMGETEAGEEAVGRGWAWDRQGSLFIHISQFIWVSIFKVVLFRICY